MDLYLINLDRSTDRLAEFTARNRHLPPYRRFSAIEGKTLSRVELQQKGVLTPDLRYSDGALGAALSHIALWDIAIAENRSITIIEDDAIFNEHFVAEAEAMLSEAAAGWHLYLWGYNFDSALLLRTVPHITPFVIHFSQEQLSGNVDAFQHADLRPRPFKLVQGFGIPCYTVSPEGARALKEFCLPLRKMWIDLLALNRAVPNIGIDVMMNANYVQMNAVACFPPLVVSLNDKTVSLSHPSQPQPHR